MQRGLRMADCVVRGYRLGSATREAGSLLLGLFNREGIPAREARPSRLIAGLLQPEVRRNRPHAGRGS